MTHQQTINIQNTSNASLLPYTSGSGNREDYCNLVVPLYEATITGDWETANLIFDKRPDLIPCGLSNLGTALHVVATAKETNQTLTFVKNLVRMMTVIELEIQNKHGNTAFWVACASGKKKMAKIMMEKNSRLLDIRGKDEYLPLSICAKRGSYNIAKWLYENSKEMRDDHWTDLDRDITLLGCVENDMFDLAVKILEDRPELARNVSVLEVLARKPDAFERYKLDFLNSTLRDLYRYSQMEGQQEVTNSTNTLKALKLIWGHVMATMNLNEIEDMLRGPPTTLDDGTIQYSSRILFVAAERGNTKFMVELLRTYPDLMLNINDDGLTIFHIAVMHRHQDIYSLLYEIGDSSNDICMLNDKSANNMLHLVGKTSKEMAAKRSGATLLMQQELNWFEEVERMMPPYLREAKNKHGQTPFEIFSKENEYLVSKGLDLMKDFMIVATLIITVSFAVAFTVPGGYNEQDGLPIFIQKYSFFFFAIADAISLVASSSALIVFLSVLSSSGNQRALMRTLPLKLSVCLILLVISVSAMMMTFIANFFVIYHNKKWTWLPIFVGTYAAAPIIQLVIFHNPFLTETLQSVYSSRYLFKPVKSMLYTTKVPKPSLP